MSYTKNITIKVTLSDDHMPEKINWKADDLNESDPYQEAKAFLLSMFDPKTMETLKIDLWTKDFQVIEMDRFMFQTLRALADTYFKATKNSELASDFQRFAQYFGEATEIISKSQ